MSTIHKDFASSESYTASVLIFDCSARTLSYSHSNRNIGLPTPESLPRRPVVASPPTLTPTASFTEVTSSGNDAHSHSDRQNLQTSGSPFGSISLAIGYFSGFIGGFRSSSRMFLPEVGGFGVPFRSKV